MTLYVIGSFFPALAARDRVKVSCDTVPLNAPHARRIERRLHSARGTKLQNQPIGTKI